MTVSVRPRLQRLLLLQLFSACLLLAAHTVSGHRVGRQLIQTKRHTLNLAWTIRGSCGASFLKNATYNFEVALAQASLADLKRAVPSGNVVFMDYADTANGGTSCKDLQVDWTADPFAGYYVSYQFTAVQSLMEQLRTDARKGKGYGNADPKVYSSTLLVPQNQLPRQGGGAKRRIRAAFANNKVTPDYQSTLEYASPLAPLNPNPPGPTPSPPSPPPPAPSPSPAPITCANMGNGLPFNCSANSNLKPNPSTITNPSQANCCNMNPTCMTAVNGTLPFVCANGTQLKANSSAIFVPSQAACCDNSPTCNDTGSGQPFQCGNGTVLIANSSTIFQPNQTSCCAATNCANAGVNGTAWTCPANTSPKANWSTITPANNTQCCGADLNCGSYNGTNTTFPCSAGTTIRANASTILGANQTVCCISNTCASTLQTNGTLGPWLCSNGTSLKPNASTIFPPNQTACCASPVTCGAGNVYTNATTNVTTTGPWQCPAGYIFRANSTNVQPPSNAVCCDLVVPNCTTVKNSVYNPSSNVCECTGTGFTLPGYTADGAKLLECLPTSTISCPSPTYSVAAKQINSALAMCLANGTTTCPSPYTLRMFTGNPSVLTECRPPVTLTAPSFCGIYTDYIPIWNDTTQSTSYVGCVKAADNACPYVAYRNYPNYAMADCRVTSRCPVQSDVPNIGYNVPARSAAGQLLACLIIDPTTQQCPAVAGVINTPVEVTSDTPSGCGGTTSIIPQCLGATTVECWASGITSCPANSYLTQLRDVTSAGVSYIVGCRTLKSGTPPRCDYTQSLMTPQGSSNGADPNAGTYTINLINSTTNLLMGCIVPGATTCPLDFPLATFTNGGALSDCRSSGSSGQSCSFGQLPAYNAAGNLEACFSTQVCPDAYPITVRSVQAIAVKCLARGSTCPDDANTQFYAPYMVNGTSTTLLSNCLPTGTVSSLTGCTQQIGTGPSGTIGLYSTPIQSNIATGGSITGCMLTAGLTVCPAEYPFAVYSSSSSTTLKACGPAPQTCATYPTQITIQDQTTIVGCLTPGTGCPAAFPAYVASSAGIFPNLPTSSAPVQCISNRTTCAQANGIGGGSINTYRFTLVNAGTIVGCISSSAATDCSVYAAAGFGGIQLKDSTTGALVGCTTTTDTKACPPAYPFPYINATGNYDECRSSAPASCTAPGYPTALYNSTGQLVGCSAPTTDCGSGVIVAATPAGPIEKCLQTTTCPSGSITDANERSFPLYKGITSLGAAKLYMCIKTPTSGNQAASDCTSLATFGYNIPMYSVIDRITSPVVGCVSSIEMTPCPAATPLAYLDASANITECRLARTGTPPTCSIATGTALSTYTVRLTNNVGSSLAGCMSAAAATCPTYNIGSKAYNYPFFVAGSTNTVVECRVSQPSTGCAAFASYSPATGVTASYTIPAYSLSIGQNVGDTATLAGCIQSGITSCPAATGYSITWVKSDNTIGGCYPSAVASCPGSGPTFPLRDVNGTTLQGCSALASSCPAPWPIKAIGAVGLTPPRTGTIEACWAASGTSACTTTYPIALCANSTAPGNITLNSGGVSACAGGPAALKGCLKSTSSACPDSYPFPVANITGTTSVSIKACYLSDGGATTCQSDGLAYHIDAKNGTSLFGCANTDTDCTTAEQAYFGLNTVVCGP